MGDDIDLQRIAEDERIARELASGDLRLAYDDTAEVPDLPPPGAPVNVIRPLRIPHDLDVQVRELAEQRGVTISVMLRELIVAGLQDVTARQSDPLAELRHLGAAVQRVADTLALREQRDAA
ncbi:hypothetical protein AB0J72_03465 [Dactylosporangium sp. NPDC049742]|uniref:hypothetical protein n=1 Tax=Dactylosporangium sp. NPDC049742 TaxID=3154737 RepID=UPI00343A7C46